MMAVVWVVLVVLAVGLFVALGALVELFRSVEQLRAQSGVLDIRTQLDVTTHADALMATGLPQPFVEAERSLILVLSDRCSTCDLLADRLSSGLPAGLLVILQPHHMESAQAWLKAHSLDDSDQIMVDLDSRIVDALGIQISPAALRLRGGDTVAAHTVPSARRLEEDLRWLHRGGVDEPDYGPMHKTFRPSSQLSLTDVSVPATVTIED